MRFIEHFHGRAEFEISKRHLGLQGKSWARIMPRVVPAVAASSAIEDAPLLWSLNVRHRQVPNLFYGSAMSASREPRSVQVRVAPR